MATSILISFTLLIQLSFSTYIPCESNQHCFIDCNAYANGCSGDIINATKASSLTISCRSEQEANELNGGCQLAQIHCPSADSSKCSIICEDVNACYQTKIYSAHNTELNLSCLDSQGSCLKTDVNANEAQNVTIRCFGVEEFESASSASCQHLDITAGNAKSVSLECVDDYACFDVDLQASNAHYLMVSARGDNALSSSNIYASHANAVTVKCLSLNNDYACSDLSIEAPSNPSKPLTNIICEGMGCQKSLHLSSDRGGLDFNISLNGCNECDGVSDCIGIWDIQCPNSPIDLFYGDACESANCNCDEAVSSLISQTINDFDQCEVFEFDYQCEAGTDCIIDCNQWEDGCYDKLIHAQAANSLSIVCNSTFNEQEYGGCESSHIYCPSNEGSQCNIDCLNENACFELEITLKNPIKYNNALNLTCYDDDACMGTKVYAEGMTNTNVSINCVDTDACDSMSIYANSIQNMKIRCEGDSEGEAYSSCDGLVVYAMNVSDKVSLVCDGDYSCYQISLLANDSTEVSVYSLGNFAAYEGNVIAQSAKTMSIECNSISNEYGCYDINFYIPVMTDISCEGHGCNHLSLFAKHGFEDIKSIILNGCKECGKHSCIKEWSMQCGLDYDWPTQYFGRNESCSSANCGCVENLKWKNDQNQQCNLFEIDQRCIDGQDCTFHCDEKKECLGQTFWAGNASSLTVYCTNVHSCDKSIIYCPIDRESTCQIFCSSKFACNHMDVYGDDKTTLNVDCAGDRACQGANVYGYRSQDVTVNCTSEFRTCNWLHVWAQYASSVNVNCVGEDIHDAKHRGLCHSIRVYTQHANLVNVQCIGNQSCAAAHIEAKYAKHLIVEAQLIDAMMDSLIHAQNVSAFELSCNDYGCSSSSIYLPANTHQSELFCYGFGCNEMRLYTTNGMATFSEYNLNFNGCGACRSIDDCVDEWMIFCNNQSQYDTSTILTNGMVCSASGCDCDDGILSNVFDVELSDPHCHVRTPYPIEYTTAIPSTAPEFTLMPTQGTTGIVVHPVTSEAKEISNNGGGGSNMVPYILVAVAAVFVTIIVISIGTYLVKKRKSNRVVGRIIREIVLDDEMDKKTEMTFQESLNPTVEKAEKPYVKL